MCVSVCVILCLVCIREHVLFFVCAYSICGMLFGSVNICVYICFPEFMNSKWTLEPTHPSAFILICNSTADHVYIHKYTGQSASLEYFMWNTEFAGVEFNKLSWAEIQYISNKNRILIHRNITLMYNFESRAIFWIFYKETHSQTHSWCGWSWLDIMNKTLSLGRNTTKAWHICF